MGKDSVTVEDLLATLNEAQILEDYPDHRRGPCCLVLGKTEMGRSLHVVCTYVSRPLVIITVYDPQPPKWVSPYERSR